MLGTDIGRIFEELFKQNDQRLIIIRDESVMLKGMYRYIEVLKLSEGHS